MNTNELQGYIDALYNRCYRILHEHELAWDAVQEIMARYCESSKKENIQKPLHYLYRLSTNHCIDLLRRRQHLLPMDPLILQALVRQSKPTADESILVQELLRDFGDEVVKLLIYRYIDGMTYLEIGTLCGLSDRGAQKKLERIKKQIRIYLEIHIK